MKICTEIYVCMPLLIGFRLSPLRWVVREDGTLLQCEHAGLTLSDTNRAGSSYNVQPEFDLGPICFMTVPDLECVKLRVCLTWTRPKYRFDLDLRIM